MESLLEKVTALDEELTTISTVAKYLGPRPADVFLAKLRILKAQFLKVEDVVDFCMNGEQKLQVQVDVSRFKEYNYAVYIYDVCHVYSFFESEEPVVDATVYEVALAEYRRVCTKWKEAPTSSSKGTLLEFIEWKL